MGAVERPEVLQQTSGRSLPTVTGSAGPLLSGCMPLDLAGCLSRAALLAFEVLGFSLLDGAPLARWFGPLVHERHRAPRPATCGTFDPAPAASVISALLACWALG